MALRISSTTPLVAAALAACCFRGVGAAASSPPPPPPAEAPAPAAATPTEPAQDPAAAAILASVERHYASLPSATASFRQTYRSASIGDQVVEEGRIWIKRPGHMRWDYRSPDRKVFLARPDGTTLTYVPDDRTAVEDRLSGDAPYLDLLLGHGTLASGFRIETVRLKDPVAADSAALKLVPLRPQGTMQFAYLEVDPATSGLLRVLVVDALGNESDLVLSKVKEGASVKDSTFDLDLPAGIEVRHAAPPAAPAPAGR